MKVRIGSGLQSDIRSKLLALITGNPDCFAWLHPDMTEIDVRVITHTLGVNSEHKPVYHKWRKFAFEQHQILNEEMNNLLQSGMVQEVKYLNWLANVVVVKKKNGNGGSA